MRVVFDGSINTSYGQLYVTSGSSQDTVPDRLFFGQSNGLCGAARPGVLFLVIGLHTGTVPVRVKVDESAPPLGEWEEVVEVSFVPDGPTASLFGWSFDLACTIDLPAETYRARWSASGMDAAHAHGVADEENPAPDRYELTFWPAAPAPDELLRRFSRQAAYWHDDGFPRDLPPVAIVEEPESEQLRNLRALGNPRPDS